MGIGLVAFVIALNVLLALLHSLWGGTPSGPTSSSYATAPDGVAAYASLLGRVGHRVSRLRGNVAGARLDPATTVVLLDPAGPVTAADAGALRSFAAAGGRLVVGGASGSWLDRILPRAPVWSPTPIGAFRTLAPWPGLGRVSRLEAPGHGSWEGGAALPVLGDSQRSLLALGTVGSGRVWLLADVAPLQNRRLDEADDAALGLVLAGPRARDVTFLEGYHGYGTATGFAAVPGRWWIGFGLLAAAALALMLASGRRFGPPQASTRDLPPPRREYVESLGGILARARPREEAIAPVRTRIEELASERGGLNEPDATALAQPARTDADVIAVGRVLSRLERESRP